VKLTDELALVAVFVLRMTDAGLKPTVRPVAGTVLAASETVSLNPELTRVRVAEPVVAELKVTLEGVRPIVNEITVTGTVTE
jgi:hypothetical protein